MNNLTPPAKDAESQPLTPPAKDAEGQPLTAAGEECEGNFCKIREDSKQETKFLRFLSFL